MYRAIIFDLDGTLLNTLDDLADSMNAALCDLGHPTHATAAYRRFVGDGVTELARRALPATAVSDDLDRCVLAMREHYEQRWSSKTKPYAGIELLLNGLVERSVPMSVLSNKPHEMTKRVVTTLLAQWEFNHVYGARSGFARKPDPSVAWQIARSMGSSPGNVVYLGDTDTDMRTAVAAGMYAVGAQWGFRDRPELEAAGAALIVKEPQALLDLFHGS